jgi:putative nucleotidyltransferase with HDIG domain
MTYSEHEMGEPFRDEPVVILCSVPPEGISTIEVAQSLRMNYPSHPIYYILESREGFDRPTFIKNGFTDAFLMPNDRQTFETALKRDIAVATKGALKVFREVQLVDIEVGMTLGFDLFLHLPANNRHIKIVSERDPLTEAKAGKLLKHKINSASVSEDQISKFYKFSADRLRTLGKGDTLTESEKQERRENAVRGLLTGIFSEGAQSNTLEKGRGIMQDCNEIVKSYIVGESTNSWYERFLKISSSANGTYNHAANVSSLACLLAIGLGITDVEDIGLAGLLHDIGVADLPAEICEKAAADRTSEEEKIYETHPLKSVAMIKNKKIVVSEKVMTMISQHHERYDGKGYPNRPPGERLLLESQILAVANEIEHITRVVANQARVNMLEAARRVLNESATSPGGGLVSTALAKRILTILPEA